MRASIRTFLGLTVGVALFAPTTTHAQTIPSNYTYLEQKQETGPFIGYMTAQTGRFGYGPKGGSVLGVRWGIEAAGPISFEGVVGTVNGERDLINPGRDEGDRVVGQTNTLLTTVDLRMKFSFIGARAWNGLSPFIVFGGGLVFDAASEDPAELDILAADRFDFGSSFFGTLGTGSRWFVSERFGVRADAVFSLWKLDTPPGFSDPDRTFENVEEGEWSRGLSFTISGVWRW
jgi:hypothetical protein